MFGVSKVREAWNGFQAARWLQAYMKANPIGGLANQLPGMGKGQPIPFGMDQNLKAIGIDPYVFVAVNTIGKALSEAPLICEVKRRVRGEYQWERDETSPLAKMLVRPNNDEPMLALSWKMGMSLVASGDAYFLHDKASTELYHVYSPHMKVVRDQEGSVSGYHYRNARGQEANLDVDQVIHIRLPNPLIEGESYGFSPVKPARESILINYFNERFIRMFFQRGAWPGGVLTTPQNIGEKQREPTRQEWKRVHGGADNSHEVAILGNGYLYNTVTPPLKDLVVDAIRKGSREVIFSQWNMPPVLAGILDGATYANAYTQIKVFYNTGIFPVMNLVEATLNLQLVAQYGDEMRVRYDRSQILAMQEDQNEQMDRATKGYQGGLVSLNEGREMIGKDSVDNGELFYVETLAMQFAVGAPDAEKGQTGGAARSSAFPQISLKGPRPISNEWEASHARHEKRYENEMQKFLDDEVERVLVNLDRISDKGRWNHRIYLQMRISKDGPIDPDDIKQLFDTEAEREAIIKALGPLIKLTVESGGTEAALRFNLKGDFNVADPGVQSVVSGFRNKLVQVVDTTYEELKAILRQSYVEGWGYESLAQTISETHAFSMDRSRLIARTETTGMLNGGAIQSYTQAGVTHKKWIATLDEKTRQPHGIAHGETVPMKAFFIRTGEQLMNPGDQRGSGWNVCNCRCAVVPSFEPEEGFEEELSEEVAA